MSPFSREILTGFTSNFTPSETAQRILRDGRIIEPEETAGGMIERMVHSLFFVEKKFGTSEAETRRLMNEFGSYLDSKYCVMSTPVMNNAGRYQERPLSACTVPPVDLRKDLAAARTIVDRFHIEGMGTGFNLDTTDDPA